MYAFTHGVGLALRDCDVGLYTLSSPVGDVVPSCNHKTTKFHPSMLQIEHKL